MENIKIKYDGSSNSLICPCSTYSVLFVYQCHDTGGIGFNVTTPTGRKPVDTPSYINILQSKRNPY